MKKPLAKNFSFAILIPFLCVVVISFTVHVAADPPAENYDDIIRVGVVGDTGIGERAYHPGFTAIAQALSAPIYYCILETLFINRRFFHKPAQNDTSVKYKKPLPTHSNSNCLSLAIMTYLRMRKNQRAQDVGKKLIKSIAILILTQHSPTNLELTKEQ